MKDLFDSKYDERLSTAKGVYNENRRLIPDQPLPVVVIPKDKQEDTNKK
jgi:hypothetical protein